MPVLVGAAEEEGHLVLEVAGMMGGLLTSVFTFPGMLYHVTLFRFPGAVLIVVFNRHGRHRDQRQHEKPDPRHPKNTRRPLLSETPFATDPDTIAVALRNR